MEEDERSRAGTQGLRNVRLALVEWPLFRYAAGVPKPRHIELPGVEPIAILYEDRSALAIDKPPGWMLVPFSWQKTNRNLQAAITSSIAAGDFWARSRSLRFLQYVHRLDTETSGVLLFGKSPGAVHSLSRLFESRQMEKRYLAVVCGLPVRESWSCRLSIGPDPSGPGKMRTGGRDGKPAETEFRVLARDADRKVALVEARPFTGRTHQIRLHLTADGLPILGDPVYGGKPFGELMGLRAVELRYSDPFTRRPVRIHAADAEFLKVFGFGKEEQNTNG